MSSSEHPTDIIRFDHVGLQFSDSDESVFQNISFRLLEGTFHFLMGPSGAGKSSLLNLMHLSLKPSAGRIHLLGEDVTELKRAYFPYFRRQIGFVFQDFRLLDHLTALDNVALPLGIEGVSAQECRHHAAELLEWVGLGKFARSYPMSLSGGQKQRVAIARAVITQPRLLLADEPTGNVDDDNGVTLLHLFEELNKNGTTVVVATHNPLLVDHFRYPILYLDRKKMSLFLPGTLGESDVR